ncbi:MAG: T9SS type A sorting domain-containing protein, partial [Bacteroidia bacterium]
GCTSTLTVVIPTVISVDPRTVGISNWSLFPNPSNGLFNIALTLSKADDVQITVVDLNGKAIFKANRNNVADWNETIQLNMASGVYMMEVRTSKGAIHQRIMID